MRRSQKEFIDQFSLGYMEEGDKKIIKDIYVNKNIKALTGKWALNFC